MADSQATQVAEQVAKDKLKKIAKKELEKRLLKLAGKQGAMWLIGVIGIIPILIFVALIGLMVIIVAATGGGMPAGNGGGQFIVPKNVNPAGGIPAPYVQWVQKATETYDIPMQYLSGEALQESSWDTNAYADYAGSHAMGLMQFEPESFSGSMNPYTRIDAPDVNENRIKQYGGYGVDGDGLWEPTGTAFNATPTQLQQGNQACQANNHSGCFPYASPYDPADGLMSGANYLSSLYNSGGTESWGAASEQYYGGAGEQVYMQDVLTKSYQYVADTPPLQLPGGSYFVFGGMQLDQTPVPQSTNYTFTKAANPETKSNNKNMTSSAIGIQNEFIDSVPLIAPVSGTVTWKVRNGKATITVPTPSGNLTITCNSQAAMKFMVNRTSTSYDASAGDLLGFLDIQNGDVQTEQSLASVFPSVVVSTPTPTNNNFTSGSGTQSQSQSVLLNPFQSGKSVFQG